MSARVPPRPQAVHRAGPGCPTPAPAAVGAPAARLTRRISADARVPGDHEPWPEADQAVRRSAGRSPGSRGAMDPCGHLGPQMGQCKHPSRGSAQRAVVVSGMQATSAEKGKSMRRSPAVEPKTIVQPTADLPCGERNRRRPGSRRNRSRPSRKKYAPEHATPSSGPRAIFIKETALELSSTHMWVLCGPTTSSRPHFESTSSCHQMFNEATKLAGAAGPRASVDVAKAEEMLAKIEEIKKS